MEIKLMLAIAFLCIAVISATAVSNRNLEVNLQSVAESNRSLEENLQSDAVSNRSLEVNLQSVLQSVGNHIDSQISNLKDFDKDIESRLAMNTNEINILSDAQSTNMKYYQEKTNILTQKYESLLKKYEALETKIRKLNQCPPGWFPYMKSCYILKKKAVDWFQAQKWCQKNEAKLVEYSDIDEVTFVLSTAKAYHNWGTHDWAGFWIGADDLQHEGVFKWNSSNTNLHFTYWLPGQPDKISVEEDCMMTLVNKQGNWNDATCEIELSFVCEKCM